MNDFLMPELLLLYFYLGWMVGLLANMPAKLEKKEWLIILLLWPLFLVLIVPIAAAFHGKNDEA